MKTMTVVAAASLAVCALVSAPAHAADAAPGKGILENSWNYVQYLFADGAASAAMGDANKAATARSNVLGLGAARELQIQADAQIQQRDFLTADKTLRRAISLAPELLSTQALLAVAIDGQGRSSEARDMLDTVTKSAANTTGNTRVDAMASVAAAYNGIGDPKRALQIYNQLITENADSAAVHSGRGEALQRLDDDAAALASFQLAGEVEPRFPNLELKRAQSLEKLGRNSEAENAYRVALQLDPKSAGARSNLARLEGRRSDPPTDLPASATSATPAVMAPAVNVAAVTVAAAQTVVALPPKEDTAKGSAKESAKNSVAERIATLNGVAEKMVATTVPAPSPASKPAAVSPSEKAAEKAPTSDAQAAVLVQLAKWQAAWAAKEIDTYLGFYAKSFTPVKINRNEWAADRRAKLGKAGPIQITVVEPSFELDGAVLKVTFNQEYNSSNFRDKTRKRMDWVQEGGEWRIQREVTL